MHSYHRVSEDVHEWRTPEGALRVWRATPHVVSAHVVGRIGSALLEALGDVLRGAYGLRLFLDLSESGGTDAGAATRLTGAPGAGHLHALDVLVLEEHLMPDARALAAVLGGSLCPHRRSASYEDALNGSLARV